MPKGIKGFQKGHNGFIPKERYPEIAKKISVSNKGKVRTAEHRKNISIAAKNRKWKPDEAYKEKMSKIAKEKGYGKWHKGRKRPLWVREKLSKAKEGSNAPNWKGGISPQHQIIRGSLKYQLWRASVFARDRYACQKCGAKSGWNKKLKMRNKIHAHHVKAFSKYPELRFDINNGITLCVDCHIKIHKARNLY